jgi:hypothetical protein
MPVGRGFVVLLDLEGDEVARALSSGEGGFTLRAPSGGEFRLRSERIGYRAFLSEPLRLSRGQTVDLTLRVAALPVRLATVRVEGRNRCRANPEEGESTVLIWEEIRKALAAATWAEEQELFRYRIYTYQRDLPPNRSQILEEAGQVRSGASEAPFRSIPAERLSGEGYIADSGSSTWYMLPDAYVLLDPTFLGTHCFHVVRDEQDRPGQVGLAFEPMRGRRLPDVEGALWLDEVTSELRSLDVRHTRVPGGLSDRRIGGGMDFIMLPSGAWIVSRWEVRTPKVTIIEDSRRLRRHTPRLDGFRDTGGEILAVLTPAGAKVFEGKLTTITGVVFDSTRGEFLEGAFVSIPGTGFSASVDSDGRYELAVPFEGEYTLSVNHAWLDSIGVPAVLERTRLVRDSTMELDFAIPHMRGVLRRLCGGSPRFRESRVIVGLVRDLDTGRPVRGARVSASWQSIVESGGRYVVRNVREDVGTSDAGFFALCDVPAGRPLTLTAEKDGRVSREASLIFPSLLGGELLFAWDRELGQPYDRTYTAPNRVWKTDFTLGYSERSTVDERRFALQGIVTDRETGQPLDATEVILNGGDTTGTRADGTFDMLDAHWARGTNRVEFHRRRYEPVAWEFWMDEEDSEVSISVTLNPLAVELEEVEVDGAAFAVPRKLVGFYQRQRRARGRFIGPEQLERSNVASILDVLRRVPGVDVVRPGGANLVGSNQYIQLSQASTVCRTLFQQPLVYVDGTLFDVDFMLSFDVNHLAAIEIYNGAAEIPAEFNRTGSDCGVLVLWTK